MLLSDSVIRRYTPPTCTLQIWAKRSALSRWFNRPLLNRLRFELHFDDPRRVDNEQVTIKGTHEDLEQLCEIVSHYIQVFLQQTTPNLSFTPSRSSSLFLKPSGLLSHELFLGTLAENATQSSVKLSVSQLFDLANALDDYCRDVTILPDLQTKSTKKTLILWGSLAAVTVLAVSIPTVGVKMLQSWDSSDEPVASESSSDLPPSLSTFLDVIPPVPPAPSSAIPNPNLPPSLASREQLPPPPPATTPASPERSPSVALVVPPKPVLPPAPSVPNAPSRQILAIAPDSSGINQVTPLPAPGNAVALPEATQGISPHSPPTLNLPKLPPLSNSSPSSNTTTQPNRATTFSAASPTSLPATSEPDKLLDTIPQVAETRRYMQQRWQAPENLKQTLEYRLIVQKDGSLSQVVPLGKAATLYRPQTGIPTVGEPFVSPLTVEGEQTIRLVLSPNNQVKTFLEEN